MPFQFQKISDVGANNPIVARLGIQTGDLIGFSGLDKEKQEAITGLFIFDLTQRLIKCEKCMNAINDKVKNDIGRVIENLRKDPRAREVPFVVGLNDDVEDFLYAAKNYLRDLLGLFRIAYGCKLKDAKVFGDLPGKGVIQIAVWAENEFGSNDGLVALLKSEQAWTTELIRKRNAVEHPGELSGVLAVKNIRANPNSAGLIPPSWNRTGLPETDIVNDMTIFIHNLLTLAEDFLSDLVLRTTPFKHIAIYEIPEGERNPQAPVRFRAGPIPELLKKMQQAKPEAAAPKE
ncbi:hypothetical protein FJV77_20730 [Mesorhizobium sp. WSM4306]|uniref:hypothetical protein n=1 Tax=Mesorhizobium sp. WSM4306 TaxID=2589885 RepID=UPI00115F6419|nr:hypothetical protein [Mesorhizobium sp. WSM4306]TRC93904.1 hypothetical protein FJV77_20730 [Mesorhizobium sp. WSM4306]